VRWVDEAPQSQSEASDVTCGPQYSLLGIRRALTHKGSNVERLQHFADLMKVHAAHLGTLALVAKDTAAAAKANAEAARDGAEATKQSIEVLISEENARIVIKPLTLKLAKRGELFGLSEMTYKVFCYGTTPAYIEQSWASPSVTASEEPLESELLPTPMSLGPAVLPNFEGIEKMALLMQNVEADIAESVAQHKMFAHFQGVIKYKTLLEGSEKLNSDIRGA
jgi:hypothetical protein